MLLRNGLGNQEPRTKNYNCVLVYNVECIVWSKYWTRYSMAKICSNWLGVTRGPRRCQKGDIGHCTALVCTVWHCIALFCTVWHCTALFCTVCHCTALFCSVWHRTALQLMHCTVRHYNTTLGAFWLMPNFGCLLFGTLPCSNTPNKGQNSPIFQWSPISIFQCSIALHSVLSYSPKLSIKDSLKLPALNAGLFQDIMLSKMDSPILTCIITIQTGPSHHHML